METVENPGSFNDYRARFGNELDEQQILARWDEALTKFREFVTRDVEIVSYEDTK